MWPMSQNVISAPHAASPFRPQDLEVLRKTLRGVHRRWHRKCKRPRRPAYGGRFPRRGSLLESRTFWSCVGTTATCAVSGTTQTNKRQTLLATFAFMRTPILIEVAGLSWRDERTLSRFDAQRTRSSLCPLPTEAKAKCLDSGIGSNRLSAQKKNSVPGNHEHAKERPIDCGRAPAHMAVR